MASQNTLFMTPEESQRVQQTVKDRLRKCNEQAGQAREANDAQSLIQQATSSSLMEDLASSLFGLGSQKKSDDKIPAYTVGPPYPPCTLQLKDLKPMALSELLMETHHRGRFLTLRRVSPVVEFKASSWTVVQDGADVERLEVFLHKTRDGRDLLDSAFELTVKEPYYTLSNQGEPAIRIDHPSDLVITSYSSDPESWRNRNDVSKNPTTAAECKEQGNAALGKKKFSHAHAAYSEGLGLITDSESGLRRDIYRNRAHVNLILQRFDQARSDALASLIEGDDADKSLNAKAYFRAGNAAYSLGDYTDAQSFFEQQAKLEPDNQLAKINLKRIKLRLKESSTGEFDFAKIVSNLSKTQGRADAANFFGPIEVKSSPGAGRGLFATRDIKEKEIIMCEKAFCVVWGNDAEAFSALACDARDDAGIRVYPAGLHKALMQKLLRNPSQIPKVMDLWAPYRGMGSRVLDSDGPVVDTFQVHDIVQCNGFGLPRQSEDEDVTNASTGVWVRAAYINHSCVSNTKRDYVGDLMILRATRDITKGEELTHCYDASSDLEARAAMLTKTWGFTCRCELCKTEGADGPEVRKKRRELEKDADTFLHREDPTKAKRITVSKARRLRQALMESYDEKRYKGLPRFAVLGLDQWLEMAAGRQ